MSAQEIIPEMVSETGRSCQRSVLKLGFGKNLVFPSETRFLCHTAPKPGSEVGITFFRVMVAEGRV